MASLVSSGTTRGEPRFVPRSAWIASELAGKVTAIGWVGFKSPSASCPRTAPDDDVVGRGLEPSDMSLGIRMISIGQPHRAVPITGATCLAIAVRIKGSLPNQMARAGDGPITIAHPSGTTVVDAAVEHADDPAKARAIHGAVYRTARRLFEGSVFYRPAKSTAQARRSA
ncbi:PrpF domain-containing protein [Bradyrhizobium sp. CB1650]|uniref:PrpF domain-containing protein n=1 Tax=Bradyrhizobium sp. CB1650 TaxID=3039153 RepID=UPI00243568D4|nr:PrpF domain-containing protein [Bradyrhizobium sp. CB1650]WGD56720.1 PrpF domain-containing protein [Bradyrhizobium sp. CB1650]